MDSIDKRDCDTQSKVLHHGRIGFLLSVSHEGSKMLKQLSGCRGKQAISRGNKWVERFLSRSTDGLIFVPFVSFMLLKNFQGVTHP